MEDKDSKPTTTTERDQDSFKGKRKLKLALPVANQAEPSITFNQSTSTFILEGQIRQADETDVNSSSVSQARKTFFPRDRRMNFDYKGQYYYIRGRNNGKYMEDKCIVVPEFENCQNCSFYGVYDGHSTDIIAELLKDKLHSYILESFTQQSSMQQAIVEGFERIESEAIKRLKQNMQIGGSTALCAVVKDNIVYTANVGDSQAIIVQDDGVKVLNSLHDFSNKKEESAVGERGGVILERGVTKRLQGELAISRSIGDFNYKEFISSTPEISEHPLTLSDNFLILATDGYWNVISPEKTAATIKLIQKEFKELDSTEKISEYLIELACNAKLNTKKDNMVLIIVDLKNLPERKSPLGSQKSFSDSC